MAETPLPNFILLPSDPALLRPEHVRLVFADKAINRMVQQRLTQSQPTPAPTPVLVKAAESHA